MDTVHEFVAQRCVVGKDHHIAFVTLWDAFNREYSKCGVGPVKFNKVLRSHGCVNKIGFENGRQYTQTCGISLKPTV